MRGAAERCPRAAWARFDGRDRTAGSENPTMTWRVTPSSAASGCVGARSSRSMSGG
jgi:hypothetical protein